MQALLKRYTEFRKTRMTRGNNTNISKEATRGGGRGPLPPRFNITLDTPLVGVIDT